VAGAGFAVLRRCGAADEAAGATSEPNRSDATSAKTERLRLSIFDFIRPSRIFTGDARRTYRPKARALTPDILNAYPILARKFEAMIARGVAPATGQKAAGRWRPRRSGMFIDEVLRKRPYIKKEWCIKVIENPLRVEVQGDARVRFWGEVAEFGNRIFRVVTLVDRVTIHNAFPDSGFKL
jgi:hypothetical protein